MKRLLIGLDDAVVAEIDARRGLIPRVAYIRKLVMDGLGELSVSPLVSRLAQAKAESLDEARIVGSAFRKVTRDKIERVAPEKMSASTALPIGPITPKPGARLKK